MQYLLFAGMSYYPNGGWGDYVAAGDYIEELRPERSAESRPARYRFRGVDHDWYQIVDRTTLAIVESDETRYPVTTQS